jgi:hypothetical protein
MTLSIVDFLNARLQEDEETAQAATPGPWEVDDADYDTAVIAGGRWGGEGNVFDRKADAHHVARHDPARALREVTAKRAILELFAISDEEGFGGSEGWTLMRDAVRQIAAVYPDCPDEWKPDTT